MQIIEIPTTGWKKLDWIIARVVEMLNQRTIIQGDGISVTEKDTGVIVSLKTLAKGGGTYYDITLYDVAIQDVTVVDPTTCAQSTIQVYIRSPGSAVKFQALIQPADFTTPSAPPGTPGGPPA